MNKKPKSKPLYPYTLQPVALDLTESEFVAAQLALFDKTAQDHSLKTLRTKEWVVLGVIITLAVLGLIFVSGYSTIVFWVMLVGVIIYLLLRTLGLKWYMRKEYEKQVAQTPMPQEMTNIRLGVQSHGLIMSLPTNTKSPQQIRGMQIKSFGTQQAIISWEAVSSWDETDEFLFIMFEIKGQKGSQIIPKRLQNNALPINTIKDHLSKITAKGLRIQDTATL